MSETIRVGRVQAGGIMMNHARAGTGNPLVLLHGWPEFWLVWRRLMRRLLKQASMGRRRPRASSQVGGVIR